MPYMTFPGENIYIFTPERTQGQHIKDKIPLKLGGEPMSKPMGKELLTGP